MNTEHLSVLLQKLNIDFRLIKNDNSESIIRFFFPYTGGSFRCTLEILKKDLGVIFFQYEFPSVVPRVYHPVMTELIAILNNTLRIGCWEMDLNLGSVRFRISYLADTESASTELILIENLLCGAEIVKSSYPGLLAIIVDGVGAEDALLAMNNNSSYKMN
jgi:hypothetical protein